MNYNEFIESKIYKINDCGFDADAINPMLYDFQRDIVRWSLRRGKSAIFADCGLGKTPMQLEWARQVHEHTNKPVLILAPLAVSHQTRREGDKFGIEVSVCRDGSDVINGVNVTNYQMLHRYDTSIFSGVVLDESSILKNYSGKIRNQIIDSFSNTSYKLACTATPAPNDFMELGNHSEFLNVMRRVEMLSMFFVHDGGDTAKWRLKGHAEESYWKWIAEWAVLLEMPSDLGYDDNGFVLPNIVYHDHVIETDTILDGMLFPVVAQTLDERRKARKATIGHRVKFTADVINESKERWIVWCNLNEESKALAGEIIGAVEVTGSDTDEHKEKEMMNFTNGKTRVLVTKPSICGFGMNWQHCHNQAFVGLSDSYEQFYQAIRRSWRYGQTQDVHIHVVTAETEGAVVNNIRRKDLNAEKMTRELIKHVSLVSNVKSGKKERYTIMEEKNEGVDWTMYYGDCVKRIKEIQSDSIHYSVFSPPFADLYTYSDLTEDMGNSKNYDQFFEHMDYLIPELMRVLMPGRLLSFHCADIPSMKERDGVIGLKDFPGDLTRLFQRHGWIYHSRVVIWKDPLVEATRTKALGLMHKQIQKDSAMCRQGLPDYLITMRKPGDNPRPVSHPDGFSDYVGEDPPKAVGIKYSHYVWQKYASPVWFDISQTNTLQRESARDEKDEKHICPLQLDVIERAIKLWTNERDIVLSPFAGIGSEGYSALKHNRRFIGIELKRSYYDQAVINLQSVVLSRKQGVLDL